MVWYAWLILAWNALLSFISILIIGEHREQGDRVIALCFLIILVLQSWAIVELAT